jgi:DNA-binding PadR family transcriptional regulator
MGTIYKTLARLEAKAYVSTRIGEPTAERGGRRKKLYALRPLGSKAVAQSVSDLRRMTRGLRGVVETS